MFVCLVRLTSLAHLKRCVRRVCFAHMPCGTCRWKSTPRGVDCPAFSLSFPRLLSCQSHRTNSGFLVSCPPCVRGSASHPFIGGRRTMGTNTPLSNVIFPLLRPQNVIPGVSWADCPAISPNQPPGRPKRRRIWPGWTHSWRSMSDEHA
jgi:hypothetical protein